MSRNTWRTKRAKFHSFKETAIVYQADIAKYPTYKMKK
ncbi:hypothetical protein RV18_GL002180 [Enterococcus termitis]|nr:hypothetical protein RV18_GL002180 [Enterococcus termitis]